MVLVIAVRHDLVSILLMTNEIENAADKDVLVTGAETGTAFDLLIEEIGGPVYPSALGDLVGRVPPEITWAVANNFLYDDPYPAERAIISARKGLPFCGRSDPRWAWAEAELAEISTRFRGPVDD